MTWWNVYLNGRLIDSVPYDDDCEEWYVKKGLIEHDGYGSRIVIRKEKKHG